MDHAFQHVLELAKQVTMTPLEREKQRRSFAYGNTAFENSDITREMVDREAEKLEQPADDDRTSEKT